jgi:hypothetical protein
MVVTVKTTADHGRLSIERPRARVIDTPWKVGRGQPWWSDRRLPIRVKLLRVNTNLAKA